MGPQMSQSVKHDIHDWLFHKYDVLWLEGLERYISEKMSELLLAEAFEEVIQI